MSEEKEIKEVNELDGVDEKEPVQEEQKDWRDNVYGNIKMSVKTLDIVIGCMIGFIILVLAVGAIKLFL